MSDHVIAMSLVTAFAIFVIGGTLAALLKSVEKMDPSVQDEDDD